ncbi:two pore calcium channel protein 2-like [Dendronephthya gigantea]|uniref:two pore calcium channel protein 2-like n=1 Tax=Dendronephthya gigantea TaxID=151771 RepID=UPI00106A4CF9|nr:two pore calcium channel protein 2-like [Dendronephthya gigantea]
MSANIPDFEELTSESDYSLLRQDSVTERDELALAQAAIFIEDAFKYRSIHHKIDARSLRLYRIYYSNSFQWSLSVVIFTNLCLAFVEPPSSLSWSSDPRHNFDNQRVNVPCGVTESIEFACLIFYVVDLSLKMILFGKRQVQKSKWLWGYVFVLVFSLVDWLVTINYGCNERYRIRRILRPYFLLQSSSLMKKTVRAISRTVPQILSVFFLLFLHLVIFTFLGMLLLSSSQVSFKNGMMANLTNTTNSGNAVVNRSKILDVRHHSYLGSHFVDCLMKLLVLLTTANNPDVMMPAYKHNRLYAVYFIIFTFIGLYCFMNLLLAVVYSQFQGYLKNSLQSSYFRLRTGVRAAFEVLRERSFEHVASSSMESSTVSTLLTRRLIQRVDFGRKNIDVIWDILDRNRRGELTAKQFQDLFDSVTGQRRTQHPPLSRCTNRHLRLLQKIVIHNFFNYFGLVVVVINVVIIFVELSRHFGRNTFDVHSPLAAADFFFIVYYLLEQIAQIIDISLYGSPMETNFHKRYGNSDKSTWNVIKIVNVLIIFRLVRTIFSIQSLSMITSTLAYLLKNLKPFGGVIVAVYYSFAIFGMMIFENAIPPPANGNTTTEKQVSVSISVYRPVYTLAATSISYSFKCGTYEELEYWANNFNDFAASLVVLWDAMVVNNWHIFLHAYTRYTTSWSQLFFVAWYLISVIICVNLFVALLLDVFIDRWQERQDPQRARGQNVPRSLTQSFMVERKSFRVHEMFGGTLNEPSEEDVMRELVYHGFTFRSNPTLLRTASLSSSNYSF